MNKVRTVQFQDKKLYTTLDYKSNSEEITPFYSLAILTEAPLSLLNEKYAIGLIKDEMTVLEFCTAAFTLLKETEALNAN